MNIQFNWYTLFVQARGLRPVPAPRSCSSAEGYTTAEEEQDSFPKHDN